MGNRVMFALGLAVGYVFGARAGRERYDQIVKYSKQVADSPAVQKATVTVKTKTTEVTKTAVAKAPGIAKSATDQVPKIVNSAKQMAAEHMPSKLGGKGGDMPEDADDVSADGHLVYPAEDGTSPVNGVKYTS
jgi:hypothetical protein